MGLLNPKNSPEEDFSKAKIHCQMILLDIDSNQTALFTDKFLLRKISPLIKCIFANDFQIDEKYRLGKKGLEQVRA